VSRRRRAASRRSVSERRFGPGIGSAFGAKADSTGVAELRPRNELLARLSEPSANHEPSISVLSSPSRTQRGFRDIPIIGMSAHALESERGQAIATGCDEFDAKPIKFDSLVATIRRVLAHPK
jgi:DNA-binding NtrC family response regulator